MALLPLITLNADITDFVKAITQAQLLMSEVK